MLPEFELVARFPWLWVDRMIVAGQGPAFEEIITLVDCDVVRVGEPIPDSGDVLLSVQYDRIIKQSQIDGYGQILNLHFGPLPQLRGCFPTKWAIIYNEPAGVTLHHLEAGIDTGPVVDKRVFDCSTLTDAEVYAECNRLAVVVFKKWLPYISSGTVPPGQPQDESAAKYHVRRLPFDGVLPPGAGDVLTERLERAFTHPPYPGLVR